MLAGVGGVDAVLLVVAADESVMPQTREHFDICRLLQVPRGVIALTRIDLADAEMRELAALEVRELVAGSFLDGAPIVAVSARSGEGLDALRGALATLVVAARPRDAGGAARLAGRPQLLDARLRHGGNGHAGVGHAAARTTSCRSCPVRRTAKVRGLHVHGRRAPRRWPASGSR